MRLAPLLLVLSASPLAHAATGPFEGRIALRLQDVTPQGANYAVRGDRVRIDVPSVGGTHDVHAVVDLARGTVAVTTPGGAWAPAAAFPALVAPPGVTMRRTGKWRAVVGQPCEVWAMDDDGRSVEACVVAGMPWFDPRRAVGGDVPGWSRLLESLHAYPVSVWAAPTAKESAFAMWATDVAPQPIGDDSFAVPRTARAR